MAVGQMRAIEFLADEPGDWAFHCHKSHHTMNAMGHDVPTMIGVDHRGLAGKIVKLVPDYMVMGERGMADMGDMQMPLPDNTLPMMTGRGPSAPSRWAACSPARGDAAERLEHAAYSGRTACRDGRTQTHWPSRSLRSNAVQSAQTPAQMKPRWHREWNPRRKVVVDFWPPALPPVCLPFTAARSPMAMPNMPTKQRPIPPRTPQQWGIAGDTKAVSRAIAM